MLTSKSPMQILTLAKKSAEFNGSTKIINFNLLMTAKLHKNTKMFHFSR